MARATATPGVGLQFIVDQIGELYGLEQVIVRVEQDFASRTNLADVRTHLERFVSEDQQHSENLLQVLRMMLGTETTVQTAIDRGRGLGDAILQASQDSAYSFVRALMLLVYQASQAGRNFIQVQQRIDNREIIGLLETNFYQDGAHLRYLEAQVTRAAEELSGLVGR